MRRLKLKFQVFGDFTDSELYDLLEIGQEVGVVTRPEVMVQNKATEGTVAEVTVYVTMTYGEDVLRKGLEDTIRESDLVQQTLQKHPGPEMEEKILNIFG